VAIGDLEGSAVIELEQMLRLVAAKQRKHKSSATLPLPVTPTVFNEPVKADSDFWNSSLSTRAPARTN